MLIGTPSIFGQNELIEWNLALGHSRPSDFLLTSICFRLICFSLYFVEPAPFLEPVPYLEHAWSISIDTRVDTDAHHGVDTGVNNRVNTSVDIGVDAGFDFGVYLSFPFK